MWGLFSKLLVGKVRAFTQRLQFCPAFFLPSYNLAIGTMWQVKKLPKTGQLPTHTCRHLKDKRGNRWLG